MDKNGNFAKLPEQVDDVKRWLPQVLLRSQKIINRLW